MDVRDELNVVYTLLSIGLMSGRDDMVVESRVRLGKMLKELNDGADWTHESKVDEGLEGR